MKRLLNIIRYLCTVANFIFYGLCKSISHTSAEKIMRDKRKAICNNCLSNSKNMKKMDKNFKTLRPDEHCLLCHCNLYLKQWSFKSHCPNGLWRK